MSNATTRNTRSIGNGPIVSAQSMTAANPLKMFANKADRDAFHTALKKAKAEQCCDENCVRAKSCCHIGCPRDSAKNLPRGRLMYSYVVYNYLAFVGVVVGPLTVGVSQILQATLSATDNSITGTLTTYNGTLPVPPAGVIQLLFPYGTGIIPTVPSQIILMLTGIKDSNYTSVAGAHRLNTRWLVETTATAGQWTLTALSVSDLTTKDDVQAKLYSTAALPTVAPAPQILAVTNISCIEQTIELTETPLGSVVQVTRVHADCLSPPSRSCALCHRNPSTCGGNRCGKHVLRLSLKSTQKQLLMTGSLHDERSKLVGTTPRSIFKSIKQYGSEKHKMTRDLLGEHTGLDVDHKTGHLVRGRNMVPLSLGKDHQHALKTRDLVLDREAEHKALVEYAMLMRQHMGAGNGGKIGRRQQQQQQQQQLAASNNMRPLANGGNSGAAPLRGIFGQQAKQQASQPSQRSKLAGQLAGNRGGAGSQPVQGPPSGNRAGLFDGSLFTNGAQHGDV
jgi:hypothetical protein